MEAKSKGIASENGDAAFINRLKRMLNRRISNPISSGTVNNNGGAASNSDVKNGFKPDHINNGANCTINNKIAETMDPKILRRLSNRVSSQRTKLTKCQYTEKLENKLKSLEAELAFLHPQLSITQNQRNGLLMENKMLKHLMLVRTSKDLRLDAEMKVLKSEINMLSQLVNKNIQQQYLQQPYATSTVNSELPAFPQAGNFDQQNLDSFDFQTYHGFGEYPIPSLDQGEVHNNVTNNTDEVNLFHNQLNTTSGVVEQVEQLGQDYQCNINIGSDYFPQVADNRWKGEEEHGLLNQMVMTSPPQNLGALGYPNPDNMNDHQETINPDSWSLAAIYGMK